MALNDLNALKVELIQRFEENFKGEEITLPTFFKTRVNTIASDSITYLKYTVLITTRAGLKIYLPNQWLYIASYFTPFYELLTKYKTNAQQFFSDNRLKSLKGGTLTVEEERKIVDAGYNDDLEYIRKFVTEYNWWGGGKTIDRGDFFVSPILNMAKVVNASQEYIATLCSFLSENPNLAQILVTESENAPKIQKVLANQSVELNPFFHSCLTAIRTKPFILLAGISGTGKSRLVRELAYLSCPKLGKLQEDPTMPGNFCMIEVKPNWHDSSELLGYTSGIKNKYVITPFVKFLVKAMRYPEVPFFVCLDEMNLAPVEQYFAEYLSVLETRKMDNDSIISGSLINNDVFKNHEAEIFNSLGLESVERIDMVDELVQITIIENELKEFGLRLPQNIIVVGTVNMDDTTHQFSRKVIDRAMTIEMNELNFEKMFSDDDRMQYTDNQLSAALIISDTVSANHALELISEDAEQLKAKTIEIMQALDEKLKDTPFRVAYRVQNELVLYFRNLRYINPQKPFDELFASAVDFMLKMKVLPRIEGDEDMVKKPLNALDVWTTENGYTASSPKIKEMLVRLDHAHYTSYWP
jgi:energy-coupling factor transporter ATP-binding protein EcfA2